MRNKIVTALLSILCITACDQNDTPKQPKLPLVEGFTEAETCLVDFVDPQDGEGGSEEEIRFFVNNIDLELVPAGFYSESNHLYKKEGDCPVIESDLIENIEPVYNYSLPLDLIAVDSLQSLQGVHSNAPDDPMFEHQWNFHQIDAPQAWESSSKGEGVIVAVIDTGVAYKDHGRGSKLEDMNKTKFTKGVTFSRSGLPDGLDDHAHGSHVAGTIAQSTNNGVGVAGVAPNATIMPLKVLSADGSGTTQDIANAIRYAADNGAHVINMSLGGPQPSKVMRDAVDYAHEKGVTVVCAAGNDGAREVGYPAGYENCMAISSTDKHKDLSWYSNYGKKIFVAAPGGDTRNTAYDGILQNTINPRKISEQGYYGFQGTSMAAPHAAAVAALIVGEGVKDNKEVWRILKESAVHPNDEEWDGKYGFGIINAQKAVTLAKAASTGDDDWDDDDDDKNEGPLHKYKWYIIGGVLTILIGFVGLKSYRALRGVEETHRSYDDDDDLGLDED